MTDNTYRVRTAQNYLANKLTADHDGSTPTGGNGAAGLAGVMGGLSQAQKAELLEALSAHEL